MSGKMKANSKRQRTDTASSTAALTRVAKKAPSSSAAAAAVVATNTKPSKPSAPKAAAPSPVPSAAPCKSALLVVSTYHAVIAGLVFKRDKFFIKFSVKRHVGRVNGTAVTQRYIASSGVDERVFLFTNKAEERLSAAARKKMQEAGEPLAIRLADLGSLTPPSEVTAMTFADGSQHLLCGCSDGQLIIYRSRDWTVATTLTVHEKAVVALAAHPGSHGALAVTIGEDRAIAVLDLVKGKLLTKWKYTPSVAAAAAAEATAADGAEANGITKAVPTPKSVFAPSREVPVGVLFSPEGTRLVIYSRFSCVVYDAAVMRPICGFRCAKPQPQEELHCCVFVSEDRLVFGTEAGALKQLAIVGTAETPVDVVADLERVDVTYPEAVAAQAAALLAGPVRIEAEVRVKNPLRHVNRVKALQKEDGTVFSVDSSGIVVAWNVQSTGATGEALRLQYVASANCQGRVTGMELYPL